MATWGRPVASPSPVEVGEDEGQDWAWTQSYLHVTEIPPVFALFYGLGVRVRRGVSDARLLPKGVPT